MSEVTDVQTYLQGLDIVDGSSDWPSVRGVLHDGSDRLVAIKADGGATPEVGRSSGLGDAAFKSPRVHVTVRGQPNERDNTEAKALEVYGALHGVAGTVGSTHYGLITADTNVIEVGQDDNQRRIFTIAFTMRTAQGAPA
jgi:hypothetical protein